MVRGVGNNRNLVVGHDSAPHPRLRADRNDPGGRTGSWQVHAVLERSVSAPDGRRSHRPLYRSLQRAVFFRQPYHRTTSTMGKSLEMIPDHSVDFVFSFDSLVHVEADVIEAYLSQMVLKLKPQGAGFIHHSNIGAYVNRSTGKLPFYIDNKNNGSNWRAESMTAKLFEEYCEKTGLQCVAQEVIDFYPEFSFRWGRPGRRLQRVRQRIVDQYGRVLNDCFSVFTRKQSLWERPNKVLINKRFMEEVGYLSQLSQLYDASSFKTKTAITPQRS